MAATRRLTDLVATALSALKLPEGRLTVALSGGADSAALAYLSHETGREVELVHIDHQLEGSPAMAGAAGEIAAALGIPLETFTVDVEHGASLEARARDARYRVLETLNAAVVTGHTRDDQVETMLINLIRGTGPRGLTGIPRFRAPNIHRPMLGLTRSETREIATLAGLPFVDDPMNEDMSLTRNQIRLRILPLMRELNPQLDAALARTAEMIDADVGFIEELASDHQTSVLPVSLLLTLPKVLADRLLHDALEKASIAPTADRIGRMWSVARGESTRQDVADGRAVVHQGALLVVE